MEEYICLNGSVNQSRFQAVAHSSMKSWWNKLDRKTEILLNIKRLIQMTERVIW